MNMKKTEIRRLPHTKLVCGSFLRFLKMVMSRKENAAGVIECNASKDFVNSLICDWFCVVSFYETGIFHPFIWTMQRPTVLLQKRKNLRDEKNL